MASRKRDTYQIEPRTYLLFSSGVGSNLYARGSIFLGHFTLCIKSGAQPNPLPLKNSADSRQKNGPSVI